MSRRPDPARGSESGFTLLELLVGLALLALLTAALAPALRLSGRGWDAVWRHGEDAETSLTAQGFLRHAVAEAYPLWIRDGDGRRVLAYAGRPGDLTMVTLMPAYLGLAGLQIIRVGVEEHDGQRDLVALWAPLPRGIDRLDPGMEAQRTVLAHDIQQLTLRYYGREAANNPPEWFETWEGHMGLPKLVSLRVTMPDGREAWPDLLVRSMVDLGAMVSR